MRASPTIEKICELICWLAAFLLAAFCGIVISIRVWGLSMGIYALLFKSHLPWWFAMLLAIAILGAFSYLFFQLSHRRIPKNRKFVD